MGILYSTILNRLRLIRIICIYCPKQQLLASAQLKSVWYTKFSNPQLYPFVCFLCFRTVLAKGVFVDVCVSGFCPHLGASALKHLDPIFSPQTSLAITLASTFGRDRAEHTSIRYLWLWFSYFLVICKQAQLRNPNKEQVLRK